jgi:4-amino-4-deoxy-L-arabinose transferase-like glycosyltransferase
VTNLKEKDRRMENFPARRSFWIGLALVALAFVFATAISWHRWPDLIVDFGGQLYIPWRISNGAVLYRDLFYFAGGPFSQYFNALLFKVFGASFLMLIVANLTFVAATLLLIYRRFVAATDVLTATTICLGIVLVFAFGQYSNIGNYNYIAPYSHEVLHGLLLSICAVVLLSDWLVKEKICYAFAAGFCSGLGFLTKPDVFVALAATCIVAFIIFFVTRRRINFAAKSLAAFLFAGMIPSLGFFLYFFSVENLRESLRSVIFGWLPLFQTAIAKNPYYQWCMGFDRPFTHLREIAVHFLFVAIAVAFYAMAFRFAQKLKSKPAKCFLLLLLVAPLLFYAIRFNWTSCGASLPLLGFTTCILLRENYKKLSVERKAAFPILWSVFGLVLLLKLGLFPRIWHYGFALAMPAFASAVYLLLWLLPRLLENKFQVPARPFRAIVWLVLMIGFGNLFFQSKKFYASKNLAVGEGNDRIMAFGPQGNSVEARTTKAALAWIETNVPPDATLAALPQGVIVNFLSRRINPTPDLDWNPTMFDVFSQEKMTAAFEKNPPDYVLLVEWNAYEFGIGGEFGHYPGYGVELMRWIDENYALAQLFGSEPLQKKGLFGIKILKRISAAPPQNKIENRPPPA